MRKEKPAQESIAERVLLYRQRRDALARDLAQYRNGTLSIGERKIGEPVTQGTLTHIMFLQRMIEDLSRVISAYSPPLDAKHSAKVQRAFAEA
jgi:hypothetical protein